MEVLGMLLAVFLLAVLFLIVIVVAVVLTAQKNKTHERRIAALEEALASVERRLPPAGVRPQARETLASRPPAPPIATPPIVPSGPSPEPLARPARPPEAPASVPPGLASSSAGPGTAGPASPPIGSLRPPPQRATPPSPNLPRGETVTLGGLMREPAPAAASPDRPEGSAQRGVSATVGPPPPAIDWERYIGIRGAAILGGIVLAIAGLLLFQYSIQHGWITPLMRVVTGIVVGLGCLGVAEWLKARGFRYTPEATIGAGIVILYASFWASYSLYALLGLPAAFGLMTLVTIGCCLLSLRHESQIIAVLGLVGGFATPLILHSDVDRPIGLFGYALLLDLGLLAIGRSKRWPSLTALSVGGTLVLQMAWIGTRMTPDRLLLALGILAVFAVVFALGGDSRRDARGSTNTAIWVASQAGGVLLPFLFALYFAARTDLGPHLYPIACLVGLLVGASGWIARRREIGLLGAAGAAGAVGVVAVWMVQRTLTPELAWEAVGVAAGLVALLQIFVELDFTNARPDGPATTAVLAIGGFFIATIAAAGTAPGVGLWPWLALWLFMSGALYRLGSVAARAPLSIVATIGTALGLAVFLLARVTGPLFPGWNVFMGLAIGISALAAAVPLALPLGKVRAAAAHAGAVLPAILLFALAAVRGPGSLSPVMFLGGALALGVLTAWASAPLSEGVWMAIAAGLTAWVHTVWTGDRFNLASGISSGVDTFWNPSGLAKAGWTPVVASAASPAADARIGLLVTLGSVLIFTAWPFLAGKRLAGSRTAWFGAALAAPLWFPATRRLFVAAFGDGAIGLLPIALAILGIGAAVLLHRTRDASVPLRPGAIVTFSVAAFGFVTIAVPLQLSNEWITIGWALQSLAAIALWRRLDHPGLKYGALGLLAAVCARLLLNPEVLTYHPRADTRILNWITITYLVPAAAMLACGWILRGREAARARGWEAGLYTEDHDLGSIGATVGAIFVVFAWLNLTVLDWFATGSALTLHLAHVPAADLTLSIVWALYALALLGFGMAGASQALRWLSLSFLVLTIGKVFLYDLGQLKDLYRVASLAGLAVSLLLVSLLYQRFVFRKR